MDKDLKKLMHLPRNEIHNELVRLGLPPDLRAKTFDDLCEAKQQVRSAKAKTTAHNALWSRLLKPLDYERSNVKVGLKLHPQEKEPTRHAAFAAYFEVLDKLYARFVEFTLKGEYTPTQIAKEKDFPYGGVHWSDWVNDKTKERVSGLFDAIPYKHKAKRMVPFRRRMPAKMYEKEQPAVWLATLNSYGFLMSEMQITVDPGRMDKLEATQWRMWHALDELEAESGHKFVPPRWQNVFTKAEWAKIDATRNTPETTGLLDVYLQAYHEPHAQLLADAQEAVRVMAE